MEQARILLVEDEPAVLGLNREHLSNQGYRVSCAATLKEARAAVWESPPDLIVLDVMMPDGSGYDFCAELRGMTTAPVLYLTCLGQEEQIVRGFAQGGDDYLTKPYSLQVLSARVMALLRRRGYTNAGRIELPPLVIDVLAGRVQLGDSEIVLSQKELQVLACLAGNLGQQYLPEDLYRAVWGEYQGERSRNTIFVHISRLRKKLGENCPFELRSSARGYSLIRLRYPAPQQAEE